MLVEKPVDGLGQGVAHARDRADGIGARAQVGHTAQIFEGVALGRDRIGVGIVDPADHIDGVGLDLDTLVPALRFDQPAACNDGAAGDQVEDFGMVIVQIGRGDDLQCVEAGAVMNLKKRQPGLGVTPGADPATHGDLPPNRFQRQPVVQRW